MQKLKIILLLIIGSLYFACKESDTSKKKVIEKHPNILFILSDNQPKSALGCYGNPDIKTPHIDALAAKGIKFTKAYCTNGMCSPTRASIITGLMPSQHGVHNWLDDSQVANWPEDWQAITEYQTVPLALQKRGYETALIGKWHLGKPTTPYQGYDYWLTFTKGHTIDFWNNTIIEKPSLEAEKNIFEVKGQHIVDFFTDKAIQFLKHPERDKPFFLQLNYDGPYTLPPTNSGPAKNRHYEKYVQQALPSFAREPFNPYMQKQIDANSLEDNPFLKKMYSALQAMNDSPETRANVASQNTIVDDGVGAVIAALEKTGLLENTIIIYSTDQGNFMGQYGFWGHAPCTFPSNLYEVVMNIPLIIYAPWSSKNGTVNDHLLSQYDFPATLLELAGFKNVVFKDSPGKSFAGMIEGNQPNQAIHQEIYLEQEETRGVVNHSFAYWEHAKDMGNPQLYNLLNDPTQLDNQSTHPAYQNIQSNMQQQLHQFFDEYKDPTYDLWNGGTCKGSSARPNTWKAIYGDTWTTVAERKSIFSEK